MRLILLLAAVLAASSFPRPAHWRIRTSRTTATDLTLAARSEEKNNPQMQTWNPLRLAILRLGLTEPMGTSPLNYGRYDGIFKCAYCGHVLFDSNAKYNSGSGWPSFWRAAEEGSISYQRDFDRLECQCGVCRSHLGHVFLDGPRHSAVDRSLLLGCPPTDPRGKATESSLPRFCINGAALKYEKRGAQAGNIP